MVRIRAATPSYSMASTSRDATTSTGVGAGTLTASSPSTVSPQDQVVWAATTAMISAMDTVDFYDTTCRTQNEYLFHEYHLPVRNLDTLLPHLTTVYRIHLTVKRSNIVYLDPNGASGRTATQSFCSVDGFTFPECPFSREGYTFKGWNRAEDGSGTLYQPGEWIALSVNPTLFAIWQDTTSSTLTINNTEQGLSVDVFPIPVLTTLQISSHSDIEKVQLFDHLGRCVIVKNGTGNLNIEIDLKNLPTGTYFLYVSSPGGAFKKQIIKQ